MVPGAVRITDLPLEVLERVLLMSDPLDVAYTAQTCRHFRGLIYTTDDERFWRALYLSGPFDDPRKAVTYLGSRRSGINWREELQRIIRARTVVDNVSACRSDERCQVLRTLLDMITNIPPLPFPESEPTSRNLLWVQALLQDGKFLDLESQTHEEEQLRARLHTWFGLTDTDGSAAKRADSRAYVYSQRNYQSSNNFGPYLRDGSGIVNWKHMQKLAHVLACNFAEREEEEDVFEIHSLGLVFCQAVIPPGLDLNCESDWAGVEGLWRIFYCFMDHRELLSKTSTLFSPIVPDVARLSFPVYNDANVRFITLDTSIVIVSSDGNFVCIVARRRTSRSNYFRRTRVAGDNRFSRHLFPRD